jgi:hypothetical protein
MTKKAEQPYNRNLGSVSAKIELFLSPTLHLPTLHTCRAHPHTPRSPTHNSSPPTNMLPREGWDATLGKAPRLQWRGGRRWPRWGKSGRGGVSRRLARLGYCSTISHDPLYLYGGEVLPLSKLKANILILKYNSNSVYKVRTWSKHLDPQSNRLVRRPDLLEVISLSSGLRIGRSIY